MPSSPVRPSAPAPDDRDLVARIIAHDHGAFESLMRRHNSRLFRTARAILKDDGAAEDAVQDAYLDAYRHMGQFRGGSEIGTWLIRIVVNQALMRLRKHKRESNVLAFTREDVPDTMTEAPNVTASRAEIRRIIEQRIDELPVSFRTVFVLREVEDLSVAETAEALGIPPATVRTRLFRARALLRERLARDLDLATGDVFGFAGSRCDRIVARVFAEIAREHEQDAAHPM